MATTAAALVQMVALALDDLKVYTIASATSTTVLCPGLVNPTTGASPATYNGAWAYAISQQMRVRTGGYAPSTGVLTIYPGWSSTPTLNDELYLTRLFPVYPGGARGEDTPYLTLLNLALDHLAYPDRVTVTMSATTGRATLATYPWLDRIERVIGVYEPAPISGRPEINADWRGISIVRSGLTRYLQMDAPYTGTVTIEALRPASSLVGGAESTTGLATLASTTEANPQDVLTGALAWAYADLANRAENAPDGVNWAQKAETQMAEFKGLQWYDRTREVARAPSEAA